MVGFDRSQWNVFGKYFDLLGLVQQLLLQLLQAMNTFFLIT